jgi:hypothetical protein
VDAPPHHSGPVQASGGSLSPTLIAEYQTQLPDKKLLQAKLHEFYTLTATEAE